MDNFKEQRPGPPRRNILMAGSVYESYSQKWRAANQMTKRLFCWILFLSVYGKTPFAHCTRNLNRQSHPTRPPPSSILLTTSQWLFKEICSSSLSVGLILIIQAAIYLYEIISRACECTAAYATFNDEINENVYRIIL